MSDKQEPTAVPGKPPAAALTTTTTPAPRRVRRKRWLPSLVWLIPIVAAVIGLTLVAKVLMERGPSISIAFRNAEGLDASKTRVKYKNVDIGTVNSIRLSKDMSHVLVQVQLTKEAAGFAASSTRFWVVRPKVAASGISGLGTLLSGAYIAADPGSDGEKTDEFTGLEVPPIITRGSSGKQFVLHANDIGSLDIGSPVYYRRIKVGQVAASDLDADGKGVTLRIFVDAPYDKFVSIKTRFWHASGVDLELNSNGFKLSTQSLLTVILGGIAFQLPEDGSNTAAAAATENTAFMLEKDETTAMKEPDGESETLLLYFNQSLRGLSPGASVDFRGVTLGEVKSIGIDYDREKREFRMPVLVQVYPQRLGRNFNDAQHTSPYSQMQRLRYMIGKGLRAQLRSGNLLTGQVYVAFDFFPKEPPVTIDVNAVPLQLPTIPGSLDQLQNQLADIVSKLSKVPFDQIGTELRTTLVAMNRTLANAEELTKRLNNDVAPEITAAMKDVRKTLNAAQGTLADDGPLQQDVRQTLQELTRSAASLRVLTDYLGRHPESLIRGRQED
ncbi:MlaD family protein [Herbaspirillum sp. RTI4]|uniref:PqiB family protein n=1 Tax=Herbaspirillum sp. RTI4 TaxID=3048640 RepID=UPI002AB49B48|nr:MlaD family protein [Herbaspirillum sp. RTI4]MDY7579628.1 MlaD family protein [Herbaspirillum sp. RTI4]MEA9981843.1 MlaD family protein [Herbaspirillum sp. RTI4]